jgi:hypothetical protein
VVIEPGEEFDLLGSSDFLADAPLLLETPQANTSLFILTLSKKINFICYILSCPLKDWHDSPFSIRELPLLRSGAWRQQCTRAGNVLQEKFK